MRANGSCVLCLSSVKSKPSSPRLTTLRSGWPRETTKNNGRELDKSNLVHLFLFFSFLSLRRAPAATYHSLTLTEFFKSSRAFPAPCFLLFIREGVARHLWSCHISFLASDLYGATSLNIFLSLSMHTFLYPLMCIPCRNIKIQRLGLEGEAAAAQPRRRQQPPKVTQRR